MRATSPTTKVTTMDQIDTRSEDPLAARKKAMDYLARREYGRRELCVKLARAGFGEPVAAAAVDQLASEGLQDDRRFAESFIQSRVNQGKGPVRVRLDLSQRGLDAGLIEEALAACDLHWQALARDVRRRKFGDAPPADFREKARQMRFLQYRGFEQAQIEAAFSPEAC